MILQDEDKTNATNIGQKKKNEITGILKGGS